MSQALRDVEPSNLVANGEPIARDTVPAPAQADDAPPDRWTNARPQSEPPLGRL